MANGNLWTIEEKTVLKVAYAKFPISDIQKMIFEKNGNLRSHGAIEQYAFILGITKQKNLSFWSNLEKEYLLNNYKTKTLKNIAKDLKRSYFSVNSYFFKHHADLTKDLFYNNKVTSSKKDYILKNYKKISLDVIIKNVSLSSNTIYKVLIDNGIKTSKKYISDEDKLFIQDNCEKYSLSEISKLLNYSVQHIRLFTVSNNIVFKKSDMYWNDEDDLFLKNNYLTLKSKEIAIQLNRTLFSVNSRLEVLNLKKYYKCTKNDLLQITKFIDEGLSVKEISIKLNLSVNTLYSKLKKMGALK